MVDWEDPEDAVQRVGNAWQEEANELRAKPRTWGVLTSYAPGGKDSRGRDRGAVKASGLASSITRGLHVVFRPAGAFKGVSRFKNGEYKVYAIYLGEDEEEW